MIRAKVTAVDANGVYILTADYGTIGPCQVVGATPAVDDMVVAANVGTAAAPDLVVVNGTGDVAIDDSGSIQSTSITSPVTFGAASGYSMDFFLKAPESGRNAAVFFFTGGGKRWFVGKEATSETGTNAGSNFRIWRYNDDGTSIGQAFGINRATGKVTVDNAGPTAGIELGAGGPTITTGTGAPTHSAPNGSTYHRQDGTASTTLYVRAGGAWTALS